MSGESVTLCAGYTEAVYRRERAGWRLVEWGYTHTPGRHPVGARNKAERIGRWPLHVTDDQMAAYEPGKGFRC